MKLRIFIFFLILPSILFSQNVSREAVQTTDIRIMENKEKALINSVVLEFPGYTKEQLFNQAQAWVNETFRAGTTSNNRMIDPEAGYIIDKLTQGYFFNKVQANNSMMSRCNGNLHSVMRIDVKEGKLRFSLSDYLHQSIDWNMFGKIMHYDLGLITTDEVKDTNWPKWKQKCWVDAKNQIVESFSYLKQSLEKFISQKKQLDDNW